MRTVCLNAFCSRGVVGGGDGRDSRDSVDSDGNGVYGVSGGDGWLMLAVVGGGRGDVVGDGGSGDERKFLTLEEVRVIKMEGIAY